ncbi:MAG: potassium-transporting ATPase subunit KdpA [Polyangiaceae bacterium]|nr:potassium-transporting ATPase subunit KdpA [Polyangiaceae bacterium]
MTARFWLLIAVFFAVLALAAIPLGRFMARVFAGENKLSARALGPVERWVYRLAGVDAAREHTWKEYAGGMLLFSAVTQIITYLVMRAQGALPFNPTNLSTVPEWLAFNTATSFTTNTNWQSYAGEPTMSHLSQAVALTSQHFFSSAVGICIAVALIRGIARAETDRIGNFWVDLVRVHLYVLLPICVVYALFLVSQGVLQTWAGPASWATLDGGTQSLLRGPVASQEAIKMLGTNGGGYFNANSAHPFENPTPLSNIVEILSIFAIPGALCVTLGEMVGGAAKADPGAAATGRRHGWAVFAAMTVIALAGVITIAYFEHRGNPILLREGVTSAASAIDPGGNMEGKEVRFGIADSALFAEVTTAASCGAVDSMHDSYMPLAGLVPMLNMQLGEVVFGGVGAGMYGVLIYVVVAVFLAGLMVGRTPEYLGKKIDSRDVRMASLYILIPAFAILIFTAIAGMTEAGRSGILNTAAADVAGTDWKPHPHGLSEMLYAYSSGAGNNGSAFAGLTTYSKDHPVFYSLTLGLAMFFGRFPLIVAALAIGGNMAKKKRVPAGPGSFPVDGPLFVALLVSVILIVGALTFFPVLSLSPIAEHLMLSQ